MIIILKKAFTLQSALMRSITVSGLLLSLLFSQVSLAENPHLVVTSEDVKAMRIAVTEPGLFQQTYLEKKAQLDHQMTLAIEVPMPKDGGGGYTHERHKKNAQLMYDAGITYQISQQTKYAEYVKDMLLAYADLYPTLPRHPKRKSSNEGKLFWQGLNEAVWLVYTIQAYDFVLPAISAADKKQIEKGIIRPIALFLSEESPHTFNKVHNHGTWATAAVGMTGYVINEQDWVEKALFDLEKSKKGGFIKQLDVLFSPQGYYTEGPYYQRYALMPFVTFAKAIEVNEPERKIFEHRNGVLLKAINTTIQLSYNQLFFPINDAIKDKGIDTIELVNGVALAYSITGNPEFLDIAQQQKTILLTGDGLKVAQALDAKKAVHYPFISQVFGDGSTGLEGALVVLRQTVPDDQAVLFKATSQGLGHGHFDKLTWQLYDKGEEIVSDYGAARFLNVEAKHGGRYLPENKTWAKQSIAHNTLVVDEVTHFKGKLDAANAAYPTLSYFEDKTFKNNERVQVVSAQIESAYKNVLLKRTMAMLNIDNGRPFIVDIFAANSNKAHQYDLPTHYKGQLIQTNFPMMANTKSMSALGKKNGYQHLWLKASADAVEGVNQITWLNKNGKFYTQSTVSDADSKWLFTELGANDPEFNLRQQSSFIQRVKGKKAHTFVSVLEPHGEYNPSKEFTLSAVSSVKNLAYDSIDNCDIVDLTLTNGKRFVLVINQSEELTDKQINYQTLTFKLSSRFMLLEINK